MADTILGPMGVMSGPADEQRNNPSDQTPVKMDVGAIAQKYRLPRNILMALEEQGEDPEAKAAEISNALKEGKAIEDVVPYASLVRATDIADEIEGVEPQGGLGAALGAGVDNLQQAYGSAAEGVGRSLGIDSLEEYGAEVAENNAAEARSKSRGLTSLSDVDGVGSGVSYAGETVAQQVPQLATSMGPVAAGAAIGSVVPGIGTLTGAGAGAAAAVAANIAQMYGFNRERQKEENDGEVNEGAAFGTAIPQATIDVASDALILTPLGLGPKALQAGNRARRIMTGAGLGAVSEAPTEAAQQAMERAQAGLELTGDDARKEYVESAVAGGLVGGIFGGGRGALSRSRDEEPTDEVEQDTLDAPLGLPAPALVTPPPEIAADTDTDDGLFGAATDPDGDGSTTGQNAGALGGSSPVEAPAFDNVPDEAEVDDSEVGQTGWSIPSPDVDLSTEVERNRSVQDGLDAMLRATGIGEVFGQDEYDQTFTRLNENGGNVEDAIWEQLKRSADLADQYAEALTEDTTSQQPDTADAGGLEQSENDGRAETASAEGVEERDGSDAGQTEVIDATDVAEAPSTDDAPTPTIENIRKKAAVLRGVPKDQAPEVGDVSLKWDEKEGGFVFSRKHTDKVKAALEVKAEPEASATPVAKAAEETAPDPTPAQAEAENYKTGKAKWRGLNLSVENKKGSVRSKVGPDGKTAWEVTMPAHYGRVLGTVGADGDHVDFYMGDNEASENVFVVDQIDPKTGDFDEQKVMLGFTTEEEARAAYEAGFSDGSGASRLGAMTTWSADQFDTEIKNPDRWKGPIAYSKPEETEKTDAPSVAKEEVKLEEVKETAATEKEAKVEEEPKQVEETDVPAATPKPEPETEAKPNSQKSEKAKIEDLGAKIGGARKDTSTPTGPRAAKAKDERPASQRRYEVHEIAADAFNKSRVGKFTISDTRSKNGRIPGFMRGQLDYDTREAAEAAIPFIAVSRNHRVMKAGDDFAIVRQVSDRKRPVVKGGFETRDDAMKYMAENAEEIAETKLRIDDSIHPALEEAIRVGEQRRENDRDVAGQDFMDIFGFRGVEFGNWNNNAERQHLLNQAFDAFLDLAEITDMPPKALSLHGEMALAFGARGHGLQGARAHYERNYGVINLTKIKGAGSLAHEWFHAMDHYFARQDGSAKQRNPNAAEGDPIYDAKTPREDYVSHGFLYKSGMREEVRNEIKNIMAAIMKRKAEYTEDQSSRERVSKRQIEQVNTHLERIEAVLSTEQRYGKKKDPATKEQMQRFQKAAKKIRSGKDLGEKVEAPTKAQYSTFLFYEPVMEIARVYKEVRGRQAYGRTQNRQHGYAVDLQNAIEMRNQAQQFLDDAKAEKVKEKTVRSEFYSEAWKIDQGTSKDYWSTNHELAARAFESYVYDRLQDIDARNDFLAYEKHNNLPQYKMLNVKPYPEGQERKDINAAFERLFDVIQSKDDEGSVMLYQRHLDISPSEYKSATTKALQKDLPSLRAHLDQMGLKDVSLDLAKPDSTYQGALRIDRKGGMTMLIGASLDPKNTINHEAIHALRAMDLFTEQEWDTLSQDAEGWMAKHSIAERYPDLSKLGQIEEAIAEEYAAWDGKGRGPLAKIKNFLQALGNFLRGKGFQTVDDIYGKMASGEVGRRGSTDAEFRGGGADPAVTEDDIRALTKDMNAEIKQSGLAGKVSVRVVKRLVSLTSGNEILGRFEADKGITVRAAGGVDERGIMRHEIIHALRSPKLWNTSHGLFTPAEWRGLVRAARADKGIRDNVLGRYADQPAAMQSEEMVAEMYRLWAADRDGYSGVETALAKIEAFLGALANLLRGRGFNSAAMTMQRIASGQVGGRGPTSPGGVRGAAFAMEGAEMRAPAGAVRERFKGLVGSDHWKDPQGFISNKLSDAMAGKGDYSLLALVPGRPLFAELGKRLTAAQSYLKHKENMDQTRNDWHSRADTVSQRWLKARNKDPRANDTLMDLMHRTTLAQVDPTQAYDGSDATWAKKEVARHGEHAPDWAHRKVAEDQRRRKSHRVLREIYDALPPAFQKLYKDIRAEYDAMGDDFEAAVLENVKHSMRVALKRARKEHRKAMQSIKDDGLTGREKADAVAEADEALRKAEQRNEKGAASKLQSLRAQFESNRLTGPYFPLARFGDYFVTVRDDDDQVISFAQFETEAKQQVHIKEMEAKHPGKVQHGLMNKKGALRDQVNPTFVADVEAMLADAEVDDQVLDAIWQRWLSTMPDQSIRTSKIHRKGRAGWNEDAFRAFGKHMFHGAHQLARLKHGVLLEEALDDARDEARVSENPNRAGALVNEMEKRHEFTMNPTGSSVVASMSSLAFLWYLGASPAAAIVNISQTTIVGTPIMAARFTKAGVNGSLSAITKAAKDFGRGKGHVENSANLSADEKKAMAEAYQRGTIDKTQAHDLASVAETGIEYNAHREKWMRRIGWFFHNAERMNREVTFLANYRLARADGLSHAEAVDVGADMTWKIHFDYQNCVDEDTECLTTTGWKRHDALKPGDRIMSVDDMGQAVEIGLQEINVFHRPQEIMLMSAKGKDRHFSMAMTPDHKCVIQRQTKEAGRRSWAHVEFIEAQNLKPSQALLRIPSAPLNRQGAVGEDMAALLGWFTSEGWFAKNRGAKEKNNVRIEQSLTHNPEYVEEIDGILTRLGASFSRHETKNGNHILWSLSGDVAQKVKGLVPDKMLTWDMVSSWSAEEMSACMDAFCKGDGTRRGKNGAWTIQQKASTNRQNLDVLQAMATSTGRLASIGESNTRDVAWLLLGGDGPTKGTRTQVKEMDVSTIQVPMVWCPTTDNGRWIARRNGRVFVTGNTARPRFMQNDLGKILTTFRQFTVNMLYRMFRDAHQALNGATEAERREARAQLIGITLSMMAHAGIKGTWGYGIAMGLLALFLPGDSDDLEDWMQDALLMEGDDPATAAWNFAMGAALNGVPGQITGANLTERLGMPNLWFRGPGRELEGRDVYAHYVKELLGPVYGIGEGVVRGGFAVAEGDVVRGAESMIPKFIRDIVKTGRYAADGVETWNGDPIVEDVNPWELLLQANGFTPARVAERYEINNRLKNRERKIMDERKDIHKAASDAIAAGGPIPQKVMDMVRDFNKRFPEYPITGQTIKQSFRGRQRAKQRNEFGISLNPKLNARLRGEVTEPVYN